MGGEERGSGREVGRKGGGGNGNSSCNAEVWDVWEVMKSVEGKGGGGRRGGRKGNAKLGSEEERKVVGADYGLYSFQWRGDLGEVVTDASMMKQKKN